MTSVTCSGSDPEGIWVTVSRRGVPNTAPSRNSGKNAITKPPSAFMKTCV